MLVFFGTTCFRLPPGRVETFLVKGRSESHRGKLQVSRWSTKCWDTNLGVSLQVPQR
jgi:hypothetical protein